jgi:hypothetical protein
MNQHSEMSSRAIQERESPHNESEDKILSSYM